MPLYFAYGANLDIAAMGHRCPGATPVGPARLMNHRFHIMPEGFASVRREPGAVVHGLLWTLTLRDVGPLDAFEEVGRGLYTKIVQPVLKAVGSARAVLYVGHTITDGLPRPGYLETVVDAARVIGLPEDYIRTLTALGRGGTRGHAFDSLAAEAPPGPVPGVRPRFATPYDRS